MKSFAKNRVFKFMSYETNAEMINCIKLLQVVFYLLFIQSGPTKDKLNRISKNSNNINKNYVNSSKNPEKKAINSPIIIERYNKLKKDIRNFYKLENKFSSDIIYNPTHLQGEIYEFYFRAEKLVNVKKNKSKLKSDDYNSVGKFSTNLFVIENSAILIQIMTDYILVEHLFKIRNTFDSSINSIIKFINDEISFPNNPFFVKVYQNFISGYNSSLYDLYKSIIVRRDFFHIIYPCIIPYEKYLFTVKIGSGKNLSSKKLADWEKEKDSFVKMLATFVLIDMTVQIIYKHYDKIKLIDYFKEDKNSSNKQKSLLDSCINDIEQLIKFSIGEAKNFKNGSAKIEKQCRRYHKYKEHLAPTMKLYLENTMFTQSERYKAFFKTDRKYTDETKVLKIDRKYFYMPLLEFITSVYEYKGDFKNDEFMWNEIFILLDDLYTINKLDASKYIYISDLKIFKKVHRQFMTSLTASLDYKEKIVYCITNYKEIVNFHNEYFVNKQKKPLKK